MGGIFGKSLTDGYVKNAVRKAVADPATQKALITAAGIIGEGFEGFCSEIGNKLLNDGFLASDARTWDEVLGDAGRSALLEMAISEFVMGITSAINPSPQEIAERMENAAQKSVTDVDSGNILLDIEVENAYNANRPSWRDSEAIVGRIAPDYLPQQSFMNGESAKHGAKGSVRPDFYKVGFSIEVKNYDISTESGKRKLIYVVEEQYQKRLNNLPPNTHQTIMIDVRGQSVSQDAILDLFKRFGDLDVQFIIR